LHRDHHRYVALTAPLMSTLGVEDRPHVFVPGFAEIPNGASQNKKPYFFFSGALYERYGIHALVQGFLDLNQDALDLIIAGYGPESSFIEAMAQQHRQLKFLGLISPAEALKYQAGAYANINPRPLEKDFDQVSIPSKVFDYIASGVPTLTTEHPFLKATFQDTLDWIEDSSSPGIRVALMRFLQDDYGLHQAKAIQAQKLAIKNFSLAKVGQDLTDFIKDIK
jgi:glycosyltransferase involved in cell wall biosynthesis